MRNTVRTSVSVPLAMKSKMDALGPDINWSVIACRAFEAHINGEVGIEAPAPPANKKLRITVEFVDEVKTLEFGP